MIFWDGFQPTTFRESDERGNQIYFEDMFFH